jgi:hypothetical protein
VAAAAEIRAALELQVSEEVMIERFTVAAVMVVIYAAFVR